MGNAGTVFVSYSHEDRGWLEMLQRHLTPYVRRQTISVFDDTQIEAGRKWRRRIEDTLQSASVAVLLVSPNFLASEFIAENELPPLLELSEKRGVHILWVAVSASAYEATKLAEFQAANDPERPLDTLSLAEQNQVMVAVCKQIQQAVVLGTDSDSECELFRRRDLILEDDDSTSDGISHMAERRQLTALHCALIDATVTAERFDLDDIQQLFEKYQKICVASAAAYQGHVRHYIADGLLIYFGYPVAREQVAHDAVRSALKIAEGVGRLNAQRRAVGALTLDVRMGIHTDEVVVHKKPDEPHSGMTVIGMLPKLAAKLGATANSQDVVIGNSTYELVKGSFVCEPVEERAGDLSIKELHGQRVVAEKKQSARRRTSASSREPPGLTGRDNELGILLQRWEQARAGAGQVVLLCGERGTGKSCLIQALKDKVHEATPIVAEVRCSPEHRHSALYPILSLLERALNWLRQDSAGEKRGKLGHLLQHAGLDPQEYVPLLAPLFAVPLDDDAAAPELPPELRKEKTIQALLRLLLSTAQQRPALYVLEDLQYIDQSTLDFLALLMEHVDRAPVLLVLTYRTEFRPSWPLSPKILQLTLSNLNREQVGELVRNVMDGEQVPPKVLQHIWQTTDGVPLYVEEMTRAIRASQLLREREGGLVLVGDLSSLPTPNTLRFGLMAELDRFGDARGIAQAGAVLGREFSYDVLKAVTQLDEQELEGMLARLVQAEVLVQRGLAPHMRYSFRNSLLQNAAYESMLKRRRKRLHRRVARVLVSGFPEIGDASPEILAHHFTEAGLTEQAVAHWTKAGHCAQQRSAHNEAVAHFRKGLTLIDALPPGRQRDHHEQVIQTALSNSQSQV